MPKKPGLKSEPGPKVLVIGMDVNIGLKSSYRPRNVIFVHEVWITDHAEFPVADIGAIWIHPDYDSAFRVKFRKAVKFLGENRVRSGASLTKLQEFLEKYAAPLPQSMPELALQAPREFVDQDAVIRENREAASLRTKLTAAEGIIEGLQRQVLVLGRDNATLREKTGIYDGIINDLRENLKKKQSELLATIESSRRIQKQLVDAKRQLSDFQKLNQQLKNAHAQLQLAYSSLLEETQPEAVQKKA